MPVSSKRLQSVTRTAEVGSTVCDGQSVPQHSANTRDRRVSQRVEYGIPCVKSTGRPWRLLTQASLVMM